MNFCKDCKYCVKCCSTNGLEFYCKMPCAPRYDYITGNKITTTFCECISIRKDNQPVNTLNKNLKNGIKL